MALLKMRVFLPERYWTPWATEGPTRCHLYWWLPYEVRHKEVHGNILTIHVLVHFLSRKENSFLLYFYQEYLVSPGMAWLAWSTFARCPLSLKCHVNIPPKIIKIVATQVKMTPIGLIGFKPHTR